MIDREIFASHMGALAGRIGKRLPDESLALYYVTLSEELTTEQFAAGMKGMFRDHTYATWPSPKEIILRAKPGGLLTATEAWARLEEALRFRVPTAPLVPQLETAGVDPIACAVFLAIGGVTRYRALNDWRFEEMRKEFLERYGDVERLPVPVQRELVARHAPAIGTGARERLSGAVPMSRVLASGEVRP